MNILDFNPNGEILSRPEGAALLKVSQPTFDNLYKSGQLPFIRVGKIIRFRRSDVMALTADSYQRANA